MKIYAVNWVMGSYIDSHIKKIFAQNKFIHLQGFIFPRILVPFVNGTPVFTFENAPIDHDAIYVDFSNYQVISEEGDAWSINNNLNILSLSEWLKYLLKIENDVYIDDILLKDLASLKINSKFLMRCDYSSGDLLRRISSAYKDLNLRSLHDNNCETYESYIKKSLQTIALSITGGIIDIEILSTDCVEYDLSRMLFSMKEFSKLKIQLNQDELYILNGRLKEFNRSKLIIARASDLDSLVLDHNYNSTTLIIRLEHGLLNFNDAVSWLINKFPDVQYRFDLISSNFKDSFLFCKA